MNETRLCEDCGSPYVPYRSYQRFCSTRCRNNSHRNKGMAAVWLLERKTDQPCTDCDVVYPYYVMQFDHVPEKGKKSFPLDLRHIWGRTLEELEAELAKCDLVCANCHAERTASRWSRKYGL